MQRVAQGLGRRGTSRAWGSKSNQTRGRGEAVTSLPLFLSVSQMEKFGEELVEAEARKEQKYQPLSPEAAVLNLMDSMCRQGESLQAQETRRQRLWRKWRRRRREAEGRALCGSAAFYLFPSLGVRVTLHLGPSCSVGSVTPAVVMLMEGPLTGGTPSSAGLPQLPGRIPAPVPAGRGQPVGPEPDPRQPRPSQSEPTAKCPFQAQAMTFLSPKLQKRNEI